MKKIFYFVSCLSLILVVSLLSFNYKTVSAESGVWTKSTYNFSGYSGNVSSSADGSKLLLTNWSSGVYLSTDFGVTWIHKQIERNANFNFSDSSADGTKLVIADARALYTSNDSGATWTRRMTDEWHNWTSVVISLDGSTVAATDYNRSYIVISHDSGATWTKSEINDPDPERSSFVFNLIASSADGTKLATGESSGGGSIYTSSDGGDTWIRRTSAGGHYWVSIASSADGTKLAAGEYNGNIYTSNDSGVTWTKRTSSGIHTWWDIASSADGKKLAAVDFSLKGLIYISTDSGATWVAQTSVDPSGYYSITSSADGTKLVATSSSVIGSLYTYSSSNSSTNPPSTPTTPSSNITIPSVSTSFSSATQNAANLNGNITSNGGSPITKSGFKYGLTTSYSNTTTDGSTITGAYRKDIYGLICGTTYHFQAYATNAKGTAYGYDKTFTTSACDVVFPESVILKLEAPSVDTLSASSITDSSAVLNAEITDRGDSSITKSGFNYGLNTVSGKITKDGPTTSGKYSKKVEGLTCDTKYYFSAYATNSDGTGRGDFKTFTTDSCSKVEFNPTPVRIKDELPSASSSLLYRTLKITYPRIIGNDVATLQTYLNAQGYNCGIVDGVFGTKTKIKVMEWQKANRLTPDGSFGPKSREVAGF